jgi:hypothetical protein
MTRVKAVYRSWAIPWAGKQVYEQRHRLEWRARSRRSACAAGQSSTMCSWTLCARSAW